MSWTFSRHIKLDFWIQIRPPCLAFFGGLLHPCEPRKKKQPLCQWLCNFQFVEPLNVPKRKKNKALIETKNDPGRAPCPQKKVKHWAPKQRRDATAKPGNFPQGMSSRSDTKTVMFWTRNGIIIQIWCDNVSWVLPEHVHQWCVHLVYIMMLTLHHDSPAWFPNLHTVDGRNPEPPVDAYSRANGGIH